MTELLLIAFCIVLLAVLWDNKGADYGLDTFNDTGEDSQTDRET